MRNVKVVSHVTMSEVLLPSHVHLNYCCLIIDLQRHFFTFLTKIQTRLWVIQRKLWAT